MSLHSFVLQCADESVRRNHEQALLDEANRQEDRRRRERAELLTRRINREQAIQYVQRKGIDPEDAEDIVQDAIKRAIVSFEKYFQKSGELYDQTKPIGLWFKRVLNTATIDFIRRRMVRLESYADPHELAAIACEDGPDVHSQVCAIAERERIDRALSHLSQRQRRIVELRHYREMYYEEIAACISQQEGVRVGQAIVRKEYNTAMGRLKELLGDEDSK